MVIVANDFLDLLSLEEVVEEFYLANFLVSLNVPFGLESVDVILHCEAPQASVVKLRGAGEDEDQWVEVEGSEGESELELEPVEELKVDSAKSFPLDVEFASMGCGGAVLFEGSLSSPEGV